MADCETDLCFNPINECTAGTHECSDFEECKNLLEGYSCECAAGFKRFQNNCVNVDECENNPCTFPNSLCHDTIGSFICECRPGYFKIY